MLLCKTNTFKEALDALMFLLKKTRKLYDKFLTKRVLKFLLHH